MSAPDDAEADASCTSRFFADMSAPDDAVNDAEVAVPPNSMSAPDDELAVTSAADRFLTVISPADDAVARIFSHDARAISISPPDDADITMVFPAALTSAASISAPDETENVEIPGADT